MFNKGDRVIITNTQPGTCQKYIGTTGVIADDCPCDFCRVVTSNGIAVVLRCADVELLKEGHMTLQEKLEEFRYGSVAFYTPTQEIYDKLMVELEKCGYKWATGKKPWDDTGDKCVMNEPDGLRYGTTLYCAYKHYNLLELTLADFPEITQVTIIGDTTVQMRAKVTKDDNGYTVEKLVEPKFAVGEKFVNSVGELGRITGIHDKCYEYQMCTGRIGKAVIGEFEEYMSKLPW